jgi:hypothetical protein
MSMDQALGAMAIYGLKDGFGIGVHDLKAFPPFVTAAFKSIPAGIKATNPEWFSKGIGTPFGGSDALSCSLITDIISAQKVPMGEECGNAIEIQNRVIPKKCDPCCLGKFLAQQEIAISGLKKYGRTGFGQTLEMSPNLSIGGRKVIIAKICVEKITEDEKLF